jgi:hypothetical protein
MVLDLIDHNFGDFEESYTSLSRFQLSRAVDRKIITKEGAVWMVSEYRL